MMNFIRSLRKRGSKQTIVPAVCGCCASGFVGWLFYQHMLGVLLLLPLGLILLPLWNALRHARKQRLLQLEFSRFLQSLISALYAGHSLESAFREIEQDMRREAWHESNLLLPQISKLNQLVALGEPVERALIDAAHEWELADMKAFAETLSVFRRSGGNLLLHLRRTAELIIDKIQAEQDLAVILAKKRLEAVMMNIAPYAMIALVIFGSPAYAEPLYVGRGRLVMSLALLFIIVGHVWSFWMLRRGKM